LGTLFVRRFNGAYINYGYENDKKL